MAFDLDDEELEATRKLNGADKTSNIKEDIKNIKQYINLVLDKGYCDCNELNMISTGKYCDGSKNVAYSMQNILAELKQKEEHKKKIIEIIENSIEATGNSDVYTTGMSNGLIYIKSVITGIEPDYLECPKQDNIPVQKVKDKIEELKKDYEDSKDENGKTEYYYPDYTIRKLEELLEDK